MPEGWMQFLRAVLKKNYGVGYLLLSVLGRSTLVLAHLMHALGLGPLPLPADPASAGTSSPPPSGVHTPPEGAHSTRSTGPEPAPGLTPSSPPGPEQDAASAVGSLLVKMGMPSQDVSEIMSHGPPVPTDTHFLQLLQLAAATTNVLQGSAPPSAPEPAASPHAGSGGAAGEPSPTPGSGVTDADDIPMYSRVTDDVVIMTSLQYMLHSSDLLGSFFGAGGAGGAGGDGSGGSPGAGGDGDDEGGRSLPPWLRALLPWLPVALLAALAVPPAALAFLLGEAVRLASQVSRATLVGMSATKTWHTTGYHNWVSQLVNQARDVT